MNARYWQRGETLDYTAEEAVVNGQVVSLGNRIGVAGNDIAEGATGALHVTGVYIMDKKASEKITMGAPVYYDAAEDEITATEKGNVPAGYAAATAEASDATVLVNIGRRPGHPQQPGPEMHGRQGVRHYRGHRRHPDGYRADIRRA